MKNKILAGLLVAGLVASGAVFTGFAQNGPGQGRNGCGYGGPPKTEDERAARQAACLEKNDGICPKGGPRTDCPGRAMGQGRGQGWRRGLRDGTGPRGANGTCPLTNQAQSQK